MKKIKCTIMKKIKFLLLFCSILTTVLVSCSSSNETIETQQSSALRIFLNELKATNNISGKSTANDSNMCFEFVYPLTLSYNNGETVNVSNEADIINLLENETPELYINGIAFPFNLMVYGSTSPVIITDEAAFWDVIIACGMDTYDDYVISGPCYSIVYPLSFITNNNQTVTVNNEQELLALFQSNNENYIVNFVYPVSVNYNNTTIQVNNEYEFEQLNNNCNNSNCNCPQDVNPVCVNVGGVIIEFTNACLAECAGYTTADFVNCN